MQITKEGITIDEESLREDQSLLETKPEGKTLFYRFSKKWYDFIYSLHKGDRLLLLKMILEICRFNECVSRTINNNDSQSNIDSLFYLLTMMIQQKRIDKLNASGNKKRM